MAGEKTAEQKYWEKRAADEQADRDRQAEKDRQDRAMGWFERLTGGMGLFEMIFFALVVGGLYLAAKANPEFVEGLIKKLPDSWQDNVTGVLNWLGVEVDAAPALSNMPLADFKKKVTEFGADQATVDSTFNTPEKQKQFVADLAAVNGGKIRGEKAFTNHKAVYMLMEKHPDFVGAMVKAKLSGGSDKKLDSTAKDVLTSLRTIINDGRMDELLNKPASASVIFGLADSISPVATGAIKTDLKNNNGKLSPELKKILITALTPDAKDILPTPESMKEMLKSYQAAHPELVVEGARALAQTDTEQGKMLKAIMENNSGKAYAEMIKSAGSEAKALDILQRVKDASGLAQRQLALENYGVLRAYYDNAKIADLPKDIGDKVALLGQIPPSAVAPALAIVKNGIDPLKIRDYAFKDSKPDIAALVRVLVTNENARKDFAQAKPEPIIALAKAFAESKKQELPDTLTANNLQAILKATSQIAESLPQEISTDAIKKLPVEQQPEARLMRDERKNTLAVIDAITNAIVNDKPDAMKQITPAQLAQFSKNSANNAAVHQLSIDLKGLRPDIQASLAVFDMRWGLISTLASNEETAKLVLDKFAALGVTTTAADCKAPGVIDKAIGSALRSVSEIFAFTKGELVADNIKDINVLIDELHSAKCSVFNVSPATGTVAQR